MHTLRLPLVGTVTLVLLVGTGVLVTAQDATDAPSEPPADAATPVLVTGTEFCTSGDLSSSLHGEVWLSHIPVFGCTTEASDPRVSGPAQGEY